MLRDDVQRVGPLGGADALAAQVFDPGRAGAGRHEDPLGGVEVDGGEVDLLKPIAGDRHRVRHDVHRAIAHVRNPLLVRDRLELHLGRIAEDRLGDGVDHVDVEALDLLVQRIEEAEVVGALVHAGDEVAARLDRRHVRAGRDLRRTGRADAAGLRVAGLGRLVLG